MDRKRKLSLEINSLKFFLKKHTYLFILAPPFSGSTLLTELISTSPNASINKIDQQMEGMQIPEARFFYGSFEERWNENFNYDLKKLDLIWKNNWNWKKSVLVEKSPPLLLRAKHLKSKYGNSTKFLVLIRHPFALYESLKRRRKWDVQTGTDFIYKCLSSQKTTCEQFNEDSLLIKYEDLVSDKENFQRKFSNFIPELENLDFSKSFKSHNYTGKNLKMVDLNKEKFNRLTIEEKNYIREFFDSKPNLSQWLNYEFIV